MPNITRSPRVRYPKADARDRQGRTRSLAIAARTRRIRLSQDPNRSATSRRTWLCSRLAR